MFKNVKKWQKAHLGSKYLNVHKVLQMIKTVSTNICTDLPSNERLNKIYFLIFEIFVVKVDHLDKN